MTPTFDDSHLKGVDIFHGDAPLDFHALAAAGVAFAFIKASQGENGLDPHFADNYARAKSVGIVAGAYHFFMPGIDPVRQAQHFLSAAPLVAGDLVWCLDVETAGGNIGYDAFRCAEEIKDRTGRWPIIYSGRAFYHDNLEGHFPQSDHTLWIAEYGPKPDVDCAFWQYTDHGDYPDNLPLDSNVFYGTADDLKGHCI